MSLVTLSEVLSIAEAEKSAIPAFNIDNLEIPEVIAEVAEDLQRPIIFSVGQGAIKMSGLHSLADIVKDIANSASIPIALHLDHGISYEQTISCLREGFTSVMIDGSSLPLQENIALTKKVSDAAHAVGVSVEAELGAIGGVEDGAACNHANLVDIEEVKQFTAQVKVDALAIGIGNAHGIYKGKPNLDFELLQQVKAVNPPPLVLHGGSGIPGDMIQKAIRLGIRKINIATEIRLAFLSGIEASVGEKDIYKMYRSAKQQVRKLAEDKIRLFSCQNTDQCWEASDCGIYAGNCGKRA